MSNRLIIGHHKDVQPLVEALAMDGKILIPVHHTISDLGLKEKIRTARRLNAMILAMDVAEWRLDNQNLLIDELRQGDFSCLAYSGKCPCDNEPAYHNGPGCVNGCRCTTDKIRRYHEERLNRERFGKVFEIVEL